MVWSGSRLAIRRASVAPPFAGARSALDEQLGQCTFVRGEQGVELEHLVTGDGIGDVRDALIDGGDLVLLSLGLEDDLEEVLVVAGRAGHADQGAVALLGEDVDPAIGHVLATRRAAIAPGLKAEQLEEIHHSPVYAACRGGKQGVPRGVRYTRWPPLGSGQVVRQLILDQPIRGSNPLSPANRVYRSGLGFTGS